MTKHQLQLLYKFWISSYRPYRSCRCYQILPLEIAWWIMNKLYFICIYMHLSLIAITIEMQYLRMLQFRLFFTWNCVISARMSLDIGFPSTPWYMEFDDFLPWALDFAWALFDLSSVKEIKSRNEWFWEEWYHIVNNDWLYFPLNYFFSYHSLSHCFPHF